MKYSLNFRHSFQLKECLQNMHALQANFLINRWTDVSSDLKIDEIGKPQNKSMYCTKNECVIASWINTIDINQIKYTDFYWFIDPWKWFIDWYMDTDFYQWTTLGLFWWSPTVADSQNVTTAFGGTLLYGHNPNEDSCI